MSIEAVHWALDVPVSGNAKVILIGVANHAKPDGTNSYPSLNTLAEYAFCDRATVRRNLRKLESDGWITRAGEGPRGQARWSLNYDRKSRTVPPPEGVAECDGGVTYGVANGVASGVAPVPPEPTTETDKQQTPSRGDLVEVFEYWRDRCHKPAAKFTDGRRTRVLARLKEGYTVADIRQGIEGAAVNPPVNRDDGTVYDDLVSICRNGDQLERYMARALVGGRGQVVQISERKERDERRLAALHRVANQGGAA